MSAQGRDDAEREEKSSLAAQSKQIGDGIRAPVAGARLDPRSRGSRAHRAQRAHHRGQWATAGAAGGCGDFGSPPGSTNLLITLTKSRAQGPASRAAPSSCFGEGGPQLLCEDTAEPPLAFGGGGTHTRAPRATLARPPRAHTGGLWVPMPLDGASGPASPKRCRSGEAGVGPRKLQDHR